MPLIAAISSRKLRPISFNVLSSVFPDTAICTTRLVTAALETIGFSVSLGKLLMASTRPFTSFSTAASSASTSNSTHTLQRPSVDVLFILSIPSRPSIVSSIRTHTDRSTSIGAAPRYGTAILIILMSKLGNSS